MRALQHGKSFEQQHCVYILSNVAGTVLYTGNSSSLKERIYQHKLSLVDGFTKKYKVHRLVYYVTTDDRTVALEREKQIKAGSRAKKLALIESLNPEWRDLYEDL
jgi:putative endonuclease